MKKKNLVLGTVISFLPLAASGAKTDSTTVKSKTPAPKTVTVKGPSSLEDSAKTVDFEEARAITNDSNAHKQEIFEHKKGYENFKSAEYDMLCLVAHCEALKGVTAYWDKAGKAWTIGFGNCYKPDGSPVRPGDRIKNKEELLYYFSSFINKTLYPEMEKYLPLHLMKKDEIAAVGSFCYNLGPGVLKRKEGKIYKASVFAEKLTEYFKTHSTASKEFLKTYMLSHNKASGKVNSGLVKRRDLEVRILFGDIVMDNNNELNLENSVNFAEVPLGGVYNFKYTLPSDSIQVVQGLKDASGRNLNDSISHAFDRSKNVTPQRKVQPKTHKGTRGR